ncbi:TPA: hypothetical protein JLW60_004717 [Escherichia coli]|nr:hypothetical protein [Escherichia coli]
MGFILRKITKEGLKYSGKATKVDAGNPVSIDSVQIVIDAGKHLIDFIF